MNEKSEVPYKELESKFNGIIGDVFGDEKIDKKDKRAVLQHRMAKAIADEYCESDSDNLAEIVHEALKYCVTAVNLKLMPDADPEFELNVYRESVRILAKSVSAYRDRLSDIF